MFRAERRKILRRILDLHGMRFLTGEINYDLVKKQVPFGHATEAPTLMQTERTRP